MYPTLLSPMTVGKLQLKNKIMLAPVYVGQANTDGTVSPETVAHYEKIAASGTALLVVEATSVAPSSDATPYGLRIYDDRYLDGLSRLAQAIKAHNALACLQLLHAGRYARVPAPLSASAVPFHPAPEVTVTPKEMTVGEIKDVVDSFAKAALRARKAGFDGVELHGGTGYLIVQFLSPLTNTRTDQYGGSLENRMRFPLEVLRAVKEATGTDFPVGIKFLADDFLPGGFSFAEAKVFAKRLEEAGIAYLSVSAGVYDSYFLPEVMEKLQEQGSLAPLCRELKTCVSVPVFCGNRISTPALAEAILARHDADGVALGRPLLRDPEYAQKAIEGRADAIVECISCFGCMQLVVKDKRVRCVQNKPK
jgi:2,4-dienoyl-CoA reductase-like NADH-dependent reductase (Old Yellow Enzyme family)